MHHLIVLLILLYTSISLANEDAPDQANRQQIVEIVESECADLFIKSIKNQPLHPVKPLTLSIHQKLRHIVNPFNLRLDDGYGGSNFVESSSYFLEDTGNGQINANKGLEQLVQFIFFNRTPFLQRKIDQNITREHSLNGNSFLQYDANGTPRYFQPAVHGTVVPLPQQQFKSMVQSTKPILTMMRKILQEYLSDQKIALPGTSKAERNEIEEILDTSPYLDPHFFDPSFSDYPFLPIARFDGSVEGYHQAGSRFFEFNAGTPSGLTNQWQLLNTLRQVDPSLHRLIENDIDLQNPFPLMRKTIEDSAEKWTGIKPDHENIIVAISPGPLNGAHPDIAYTAGFMGIPLVSISDLYVDPRGYIRLVGKGNRTGPRVIGMYNRVELSYLLQSHTAGIPMRSPYFAETNHRISMTQGVNLQPNIGYSYVYTNGKATAVNTDATGKPIFDSYYDSITQNDRRKNADDGLYQALKSKKLYISNFGGRLVDNKKLFHLSAKILKRSHPQRRVAAPPRTLEDRDMQKFIETNFKDNFVVKGLVGSGGKDINIMVHLTEEEKAKVVAAVKENWRKFTIQEFVLPPLMIAPQNRNREDIKYETRAHDWGIFVFSDPYSGDVSSTGQAVLLRVAESGSSSTNTSKGAGYGLAYVKKDQQNTEQERRKSEKMYPEIKVQHVPLNKVIALKRYIAELRQIGPALLTEHHQGQNIEGLAEANIDLVGAGVTANDRKTLRRKYESLMNSYRAIMHFFSMEVTHCMHSISLFISGEVDESGYLNNMRRLAGLLRDRDSYTTEGIQAIVEGDLE